MNRIRGLPAALAAALFLSFLFLWQPVGRAQTGALAQSSPEPPHEIGSATPSAATSAATEAAATTGPAATPTVDRLAPPPTVENPTQADVGAQVYWLNCQPCHGDVGQGLTDEWRAQYPEDHQNCWASGCHGDRPYENGFTIPTSIPPVTGDDSLQSFDHMGLVYTYISAAMPFNAPGSLDEEEYLAITAFLAREHGVWDGQPLRADNAARLRLRPAEPSPTAANGAPQEEPPAAVAGPGLWLALLFIIMVGALALLVWFWRHRRQA